MERSRLLKEWIEIVVGLAVFALGVHLIIRAEIGVAPWDCLGLGIEKHTPLNYGLSMTVMSIVILLIDVALREKIGVGTVLDALLTGNFIQIYNDIDPFPATNGLVSGIIIVAAGLFVMAIGQFLYMRAGNCCGPRDTLLIGLGKRLPKAPIGIVEIILWAVVLLCGWLLGGPVGVGTVISTFGAGLVMQLVCSIIGFEPRNVEHKDIIYALRTFFRKNGG